MKKLFEEINKQHKQLKQEEIKVPKKRRKKLSTNDEKKTDAIKKPKTKKIEGKAVKEAKPKETKETEKVKLPRGRKAPEFHDINVSYYDPRYKRTIEGSVRLTHKEFLEMNRLTKKVNKNMEKYGFKERYKPYFTTRKGYEEYMNVLRSRQTMHQIFEWKNAQLNTFKTNILIILDHIKDNSVNYEDEKELAQLISKVEKMSVYKLQKLYLKITQKGMTSDIVASFIFQSPPEVELSDPSGYNADLKEAIKEV